MKYFTLVIIMCFSSLLMADSGFYGGLSAGIINTGITKHQYKSANAGYQFSDSLSIEARKMVDADDEKYHGADLDIDDMIGVYMTASLPVNERLSPYVVVGWTEVDAKASYRGYSANASDSSGSYGFGLRAKLAQSVFARIEYMQIFRETDAISANINFAF